MSRIGSIASSTSLPCRVGLSWIAAILALGVGATCRAEGADPAVAPFDGRWSVALVCADTQDRKGLVKGYAWSFPVTIADGRLDGLYGTRGAPSSVAYTGTVARDGTLEIKAVGNTGHADYSVGEVARGTPYGYTMTGRLEGSKGQAVRREIRPCTATLSKQ